MSEQKYIALVDCDSFFVSCERKLNPRLNEKAVCVVSGDRGCVIARSNEAKAMGIPMGQPLFMAKEQFPKCIYINANHYSYAKISADVMSLLKSLSPCVEVYSIDEAFIDLTGLSHLYKKNYYNLGLYIRETISKEVGIPVSVGISRTKTLAKLASDKSKNYESHVCIVGKHGIQTFLRNTNIEEVWGIGRKLAPKLNSFGIHTAFEYTQKNDVWLKSRFGKNGLEVKYELLGNLINKVSSEYILPKSISDTKSFSEFSSDFNFLKNELMIHIHATCRKLRKINCKCSTIGVILKTKDFRTFYSKINLKNPTDFELEISEHAFPELKKMYDKNILYRSIGIVLENFNLTSEEQLNIFSCTDKKREKNEILGKSLDKLEAKFGRNIVKVGFTDKDIPYKQDFLVKNNGLNKDFE